MTNRLNRRAFVKSTSAALALSGFSATEGAMPQDGIDERKGVELAIATICLDGFGDQYFEKAFEIIPNTGVKNVVFNVWFPRTITPSGIESIRDRCYTRGLRPVCLQGTAFGGHELKDVAHKLWVMEKARSLGCRRVKFTGSKRGRAGGLQSVIHVLKELAPAAEEMDILIVVENHAKNNIENIEDYDSIFEAVDSSHIGMCLDMGHFDGAGVSNFAVIERFHPKILHIDLKDTIGIGTYKTVPYGHGVTDGEAIVKALIDKGYSGYLEIEQAPPIEGIDLTNEMRRIKDIFVKFGK